ncbi:hypothetical protein BEN30_08715 [Magnetovibrio blakemorei]|uniref:Uncharacterized protein n=2 Tax=Magnetovibrio blakemorei TaxID=28181 RepID=A0A1E5Q8C1_9PROT|nr:hypothetical protein BEN30_08715 [Magnetovibrio blakemorei]
MAILDEVYNDLLIEDAYLTEKKFSRDYLGKCDTYYAYLKSSGATASAGALINLWRRLNCDKLACERRLATTENSYLRNLTADWLERFDKLERRVKDAILLG